jgi:hypothetical protein
MSLEGIVVGLLAIGIGAAWATYGLKAFTILLPIWAFFVGLLAGATFWQELIGDGFLGTTTSWVVGIALGLVLAVLSYFIYYFAVVLLGAAAGYALGSGLLIAIGLDGFLSAVVGILAGVLLAIVVLVLAVPAILVIVISAFSGAAAVVNGVLILLGQIQVADVDGGLMDGLIKYGAVGVIVWLVVAAAGIWYQLRDIGQMAEGMAIDRSKYQVS